MHPETNDILMAIGCRDVDLLNVYSSCLVMRPLHTDLDEEAELRDLFQGSCGTADPIAAVIALPPPAELMANHQCGCLYPLARPRNGM